MRQLTDICIDGMGMAREPVKRVGLKTLLDMAIVGQQRYLITKDASNLVELEVQAQYRAAGFLQGQIEKYSNMVKDSFDQLEDEPIYESDDEDGNGQNNQENTDKIRKYRPLDQTQQAAEYAFNDFTSAFTRAICADVIDLHHASTLLAHYDSLGPFFDECCNQLSLALRHYGVLGGEDDRVASVVCESFVQVCSGPLTRERNLS